MQVNQVNHYGYRGDGNINDTVTGKYQKGSELTQVSKKTFTTQAGLVLFSPYNDGITQISLLASN